VQSGWQLDFRLRYLSALLLGAAGAAVLVLSPYVQREAMFLPLWCVTLVALLFFGVGPALLSQTIVVIGLFMVGVPADTALFIRLGILGLADLLGWRLERERKASARREKELVESETRYRHLLEQASDGIVLARPDGQLVLVNQRVCEMMGYSEAELLKVPLRALYEAGELERSPLGWDELLRSTMVIRERRLQRKDGSTFIAELSVRRTPDGLAQAIVRDITERRRSEAAIRAERDLLDGILSTSVAGIIVVSPTGRVIFLNPSAESVLGITRDQLKDTTELPSGWRLANLDGTPLAEEARPARRVARTGEPVTDARFAVERPDGRRVIVSVNAAPLRNTAGVITAVVLSLSDITDQYVAQQALREREEQLHRITAAVPGVVYQYVVGPGEEERFVFVSEGARELLGASAEEILADPQHAWLTMDREDRAAMSEQFNRASTTLAPWSFDFRVLGPGDRIRWLRDIATAIPSEDASRVVWNGVIVDITERKRLEEELLQSQKMDSLGRLAGGVAHDFNNLLTVIRGYADVLTRELSDGDPRQGEVREIRRAADRATTLTRQLLALSRRQVLVPREVDLNALVQEMEQMLRRVIGENITIDTVRGADTGWVRADPGQLEQVLLNLAVNARDAMPRGGTLTIETRRAIIPPGREDAATRGVPPGDYVVFRVTDTGTGIDRETQAKIFEPFFTTKPLGEGTGLGLSTVYGIVQQSSGVITVESEPGAGTSFRIFLPRLAGVPLPSAEAPAPGAVRTANRRRRNTVLLVEDDEGVRQLTRRILEQYGFGALEARNGAEALELLDAGSPRIDAVVSDVVMPGMSGRELVGRLRLRRPDLPVLFLSGYTGDEVSDEVRGQPHQAFLQKPFSPDALAAALEELLAEGEPVAPSS
jgi:two-component system, cell cycle sensor histidine kinase and response regulator CckA